MAWTDKELREAELIHGPEANKGDTYRLQIRGTLDDPGKRIDVPGWMVGDKKGAELRMKAAEIIRKRLLNTV